MIPRRLLLLTAAAALTTGLLGCGSNPDTKPPTGEPPIANGPPPAVGTNAPAPGGVGAPP